MKPHSWLCSWSAGNAPFPQQLKPCCSCSSPSRGHFLISAGIYYVDGDELHKTFQPTDVFIPAQVRKYCRLGGLKLSTGLCKLNHYLTMNGKGKMNSWLMSQYMPSKEKNFPMLEDFAYNLEFFTYRIYLNGAWNSLFYTKLSNLKSSFYSPIFKIFLSKWPRIQVIVTAFARMLKCLVSQPGILLLHLYIP